MSEAEFLSVIELNLFLVIVLVFHCCQGAQDPAGDRDGNTLIADGGVEIRVTVVLCQWQHGVD
jgi:hypothetical protein